MLKLQGIIPAMLTPMTSNEKINEQELRNQVNRFIQAGVHGLLVLGTNGEFYALSMEERFKVIQTVLDECKARVPVYAQTGCVTTSDTIKLPNSLKKPV